MISAGDGGMGLVLRAGPVAEYNSYYSGVGAGGTAYLAFSGAGKVEGKDGSGFIGVGPSYHRFFGEHASNRLGLAETALVKLGSVGIVWGNEIGAQWGSRKTTVDSMIPHDELVYAGVDEPPQYTTVYSSGSETKEESFWSAQYHINLGYPIVGFSPKVPLAWTVEFGAGVGLGERNDNFRVYGSIDIATRLYLAIW